MQLFKAIWDNTYGLLVDDGQLALGALAGLTATGVLSALAPQATVHAYAGPVLLGWTCLLVLDIRLPRMDGLQVLRALRQDRVMTPVLLLTVRATIEDKVLGLDTGADDYLTKPFAFEELVARVRALLRRRATVEPTVLQVADLTLDPARRTVTRGGAVIELTPREFTLLDYFMRHPGRVLTRTRLAEHVWNYDFDTTTNIIDVYVNYLRKKIDADRELKLLHTVRGVGYVLKVE